MPEIPMIQELPKQNIRLMVGSIATAFVLFFLIIIIIGRIGSATQKTRAAKPIPTLIRLSPTMTPIPTKAPLITPTPVPFVIATPTRAPIRVLPVSTSTPTPLPLPTITPTVTNTPTPTPTPTPAVILSYTEGNPYDFGTISISGNLLGVTHSMKLTNTGGKKSSPLTVSLTGQTPTTEAGNFVLDTSTATQYVQCSGTSLETGGSCSFTVRFAPSSVAYPDKTAYVDITDGSTALRISLKGKATN